MMSSRATTALCVGVASAIVASIFRPQVSKRFFYGLGQRAISTVTKSNANSFVDSYDNFVFDCDGVIWSGDTLIDGAQDALASLRAKGKNIFFVTNNSSKSRITLLKRIRGMGIKAEVHEVYGSSFAAASYLDSIGFKGKVYTIGMSGVREELDAFNIDHCGGECDGWQDPHKRNISQVDMAGEKLDPGVKAVVVGLDLQMNYYKIAMASMLIREQGALFIATNRDSQFPCGGRMLPGNNTLVTAIGIGSGVEPVVVGKPSPAMLDAIDRSCSAPLDRSRTCMVGDRLDTDIEFGVAGGVGATLLVLTGCSTRQEAEAAPALRRPTHVADSIALLNTNAVAAVTTPIR